MHLSICSPLMASQRSFIKVSSDGPITVKVRLKRAKVRAQVAANLRACIRVGVTVFGNDRSRVDFAVMYLICLRL